MASKVGDQVIKDLACQLPFPWPQRRHEPAGRRMPVSTVLVRIDGPSALFPGCCCAEIEVGRDLPHASFANYGAATNGIGDGGACGVREVGAEHAQVERKERAPDIGLPTETGRCAQPTADGLGIREGGAETGTDLFLDPAESRREVGLSDGFGDIGQFAGCPIPQQRGEEQFACLRHAIQKTVTHGTIVLGRLRQPARRVYRWALEGGQEPIENTDTVHGLREDLRAAGGFPKGVSDVDELIVIIDGRDLSKCPGTLVLSCCVGAGIKCGAAVVVDVVGNGPRAQVKSVGQAVVLGAVLGPADEKQVLADFVRREQAGIQCHGKIADPEGVIGIPPGGYESEADRVAKRPLAAAIRSRFDPRGLNHVARHIAQEIHVTLWQRFTEECPDCDQPTEGDHETKQMHEVERFSHDRQGIAKSHAIPTVEQKL